MLLYAFNFNSILLFILESYIFIQLERINPNSYCYLFIAPEIILFLLLDSVNAHSPNGVVVPVIKILVVGCRAKQELDFEN